MSVAPIIRLRGMRKTFAANVAVDGVDLDLFPGEVHALVGENGAGKSTLMRVLAGLNPDYEGEIFFAGLETRPTRIRNPNHARKMGIAIAHQELSLVPELSAAENIFLGDEPRAMLPGFIARRRLRDEARRILGEMGVAIDPGRKVSELSVACRQLVEIAKGLAANPRVLILDEPTSSLTAREIVDLLAVIGRLRARGAAIVYISHKLDEVFAVADRITVLRDGRVAASDVTGNWNEPALVRAMVGREISTYFPHKHQPTAEATVALEARKLSRPGAFADVSFSLRRGEVLGIYGLIGAGRSELAEALFGLRPARGGELYVFGQRARVRSPRAAMALGLALVPEDRRGRGLVLLHSVAHNLSLPALAGLAAAGIISRRRERVAVRDSMRALAIQAASPQAEAGTLSGGNQQKIVIGKWLLTRPRILILDEPTRGIDVGAKAEVHALIDRLAAEGLAILLISSELPEVLGMSDRVLVMREGRIVAEFPGTQATAEALGAAAAGVIGSEGDGGGCEA
jgi:rhamnose transport system ATP-binding protein